MHEITTEIKELAESEVEENNDLNPDFEKPKPHPKANIESRTKFTQQTKLNQMGNDSDDIFETA